MPSLSNKEVDRVFRAKIISLCIILVADVILVPWLIKLPFFAIQDFSNGLNLWIQYGIKESFLDLFRDRKTLLIFIFVQFLIIAFTINLLWDVNRFRKKNRIMDGIGGPDPAGSGQHGTSRWQTKKEMDENATVWYTNQPLEKSGMVLGIEKSKNGKEKVWLDDSESHILVIGTTGSGKSRKILIPSIWMKGKAEQGDSMIVSDPKGELYISTKDYLKQKGYKVIALNFRDPLLGNRWNVIDPVVKAAKEGDIAKATEAAWDIANSMVAKPAFRKAEPVWENGEESLIAALILLVALESEFEFQKHMASVYYLLSEYGRPVRLPTGYEYVPLDRYISSLPTTHPAKAAFAAASMAPEKMRASFFTSALTTLRLFSDPNIADMTSEQDHSISNIGLEKTAVFLIIPDEKSTRHTLATLYINQAYQTLIEMANKYGGRLPRKVDFLLDEFGNLPPIPNFDKKITVARSRNIRFTLFIQHISQLKELYGHNAQTITGNCHVWIFLNTSDPDTAELISKKLGNYTIETENVSSSIQLKGHSISQGSGLTGRPLLMPDEILRWKSDHALVIPISYFPARYPLPDLSMWNANDELGFVRTGSLEKDKMLNQEIIKQRWDELPKRKLRDISIWLPDMEHKKHFNVSETNESESQITATVEDYEEDFL